MTNSKYHDNYLLKSYKHLKTIIRKNKITLDFFFEKGLEELKDSLEGSSLPIFYNQEFNSRDSRFIEIRHFVDSEYPFFDLTPYDQRYEELLDRFQFKIDYKDYRNNNLRYLRFDNE